MQRPLYTEDLQPSRRPTLDFRTSCLLNRRGMMPSPRRSPGTTPPTPSAPPLHQYKVIPVPDNVGRAKSRLLFTLPLPYQISCSQRVDILVLGLWRRRRRHFLTSAASIPLLPGGMEADSTPNLFHESVFVIPFLYARAEINRFHSSQSFNTTQSPLTRSLVIKMSVANHKKCRTLDNNESQFRSAVVCHCPGGNVPEWYGSFESSDDRFYRELRY